MMIRAASTSGGAARDAPGLLLPFGKSLLRRTPSGALVLDRADGEKEIVPPRCKAELLSAHLGTGAIMVACEAPEGRAILQIVDEKGSTVAYEFEKVRGRHVVPAPTGPDALVVVVDEDERVAIVDVVRRPFGQSKLEGDVLLFDRPQALLVRGEALVWWDMKTEVERILFERVERYSPRIQRGRFAYVDPVVVELPSATVVGIAGADVHALSTTGYALVSPEGRVSSSSSMRSGPLRWRWPSPAPARSPR